MTGYIYILGADEHGQVKVEKNTLAKATNWPLDRIFENTQPTDQDDYISLMDCGKTPNVEGDVEVTVLGHCEVGRMKVARIDTTDQAWTSVVIDQVKAAEVYEATLTEQ